MAKQILTSTQLSSPSLNKQRGVVLIMSLVILLVLTLIGVSSMRTSGLQERMSGNARDNQVAFEAAEIALRAGEDYLKTISLDTDFTTGGANGKFMPRSISSTDAWQVESNWTSGNTTSVTVANVSKNPEYMIEIVNSNYGSNDNVTPPGEGETGGSISIELYRVTARGYGKNPNTRVMLQSDYGRMR